MENNMDNKRKPHPIECDNPEKPVNTAERSPEITAAIESAMLTIARLDETSSSLQNRIERGEKLQLVKFMHEISNAVKRQMLPVLLGYIATLERQQCTASDKRVVWMPIETAPKDGTSILVGEGHMYNGNFIGNVDQVEWESHFGNGAWLAIGGKHDCGNYLNYQPTHWQPLPAAPTDNTGE